MLPYPGNVSPTNMLYLSNSLVPVHRLDIRTWNPDQESTHPHISDTVVMPPDGYKLSEGSLPRRIASTTVLSSFAVSLIASHPKLRQFQVPSVPSFLSIHSMHLLLILSADLRISNPRFRLILPKLSLFFKASIFPSAFFSFQHPPGTVPIHLESVNEGVWVSVVSRPRTMVSWRRWYQSVTQTF